MSPRHRQAWSDCLCRGDMSYPASPLYFFLSCPASAFALLPCSRTALYGHGHRRASHSTQPARQLRPACPQAEARRVRAGCQHGGVRAPLMSRAAKKKKFATVLSAAERGGACAWVWVQRAPLLVRQGYLVLASAIIAWNLSRFFPEWCHLPRASRLSPLAPRLCVLPLTRARASVLALCVVVCRLACDMLTSCRWWSCAPRSRVGACYLQSL